MEFQHFIDIVIAVVCSGLGWFAKTLWTAQSELRKDLESLHIKLTEQYVPNLRFESVLNELNNNLRYIRDKLDEKAEKK